MAAIPLPSAWPLHSEPRIRHPCLREMMMTSPSSGAIRVLLADADRLSNKVLARTLTAHEGIEVVGWARDGGEAVELAASLLPDIVLLGIEAREVDPFEATRSIRERSPSTRVLILGAPRTRDDVELALDAGAVGFMERGESVDLMAAMMGLALVFAVDPSASVQRGAEPPLAH
jgi:DNA-binding NarL/FixJ family response regulator